MTTLLIVFFYRYLFLFGSSGFGPSSSLSSWSLWSSVSSACGLGGDGRLFLHPTSLLTTPVLPGSWRHSIPRIYSPWISNVYPSVLGPLAGCVLLSMWFYNMSLRGLGVSFSEWSASVVKRLLPVSRKDLKLSDSYTFDGLKDKWKPRPKSSVGLNKKYFAMLLSVIAASATQAHPFELKSDKRFRTHLRKYRSCLGYLDSVKVSPDDLPELHRRIKANTDTFKQVTQDSMSVTSSVVDTGASFSCWNSLKDIDPKSIRRLKKPIKLGGIAGGLSVEYIGLAEWETMDTQGNVIPIKERVLIHPDIPSPLFSPQSFLAFNNSGDKPGTLEDHFKVFHNRAEWHANGNKVLTMNYDHSFLPRIVLFSKGTAMSSLKAMSSVLHSENRNLSPLQNG